MADLPFGELYKQHEEILKSYFNQKPIFMKADFNNAFILRYENVNFDNLGNANIQFKYIQNRLMTAEVEIEIFQERFYQIKDIQALFEKQVTSLFRTPGQLYLGSIDSSLVKIYKCDERRTDYSQNETLYGKSWSINDPKRKDDLKWIDAGIYINSNGYKSCRVLLGYQFTTLNLSVEATKSSTGVYRETDENPEKKITLKDKNGIYSLPVKINNTLTLDFVLDLGAADVSLSQDIFSVLVKTGSIQVSDYIGKESYELADGTIIKSNIINLKSLKIGEIEIKDVRASVSSSADSPLLLGQSALKKLGKYSIDNTKSLLIIE